MITRIAIILLISSFICLSSISADVNPNPTKGFLVCEGKANGRLGNQLFLFSSHLAYAWDHEFKPVFPCLNNPINDLPFNRDRIFFKLDASDFPYKVNIKHTLRHACYESIPGFSNSKNISLKGYFFSWKFFHHHREKLLSLFEPSEEVSDLLNAKYGELIEMENTVAVHVRTQSRWLQRLGIFFVGLNYFKLAFDEFPEDMTFVVFSDRINWCKENFSRHFPDREFIFIEGNDSVEDFFLMSLMKHQIISNSTYSWWAAYLNQNPEKRVIVPCKLIRNAQFWPAEDLYPPEWQIIDYDPSNEPYPDDMEAYDDLTTDDLKSY